MATLITSIVGWVLVGFLHVHYLGRDEIARKKDSVQAELQSLADWALDHSLIEVSSPELNEEYLSSKIAILELRLKELYESYFYIEFPYELSDLHESVEFKDAGDINNFQLGIINSIYNLKISIEADYDHYCKFDGSTQRVKVNLYRLIKNGYFRVFMTAFAFSFCISLISFLVF